MRKILLTLFAMALVVAFTAPSYAADFKYSGFFRIRGMSGNNNDRDDNKDDSASGLDALTRPRFTATTDKGKIWAMWEIDWWEASVKDHADESLITPTRAASANAVIGANGGGRVGVGTNRWVVDFAVPGSALRARWGRTDYTSPDKEIFDSNGTHRRPGIGVYGKLSKNISLSMFMTKISDGAMKAIDKDVNEDGVIDDDDKVPTAGTTFTATDDGTENYYAALGIKVSPTLTLTPWVALSRNGDTGQARSYAALHAKTKVGIFGLAVTGVTVGGDHNADTEASGWGLLVRGESSFGKLKLRGKLTLFSGDDNADDNEEGNFGKLFPSGAGNLIGGLYLADRTDNFGVNSMRARLPGVGPTRSTTAAVLNGAVMIGGEVEYAVSKTFVLTGAVHVYNSAEAAQGEGMDDATDYGTEFNAGFRWKIYPQLELRTAFAYLAAGDYGKAVEGPDFDDSWTALWSLRHSF